MSTTSSTSNNNNDSLPIGWNDRTNQMSEHDMKLGGIAATKFGTKGGMTMKNAYSDSNNDGVYQTSDQVRDFYYSRQQQQQQILETMENDDSLRHQPQRQQHRQLGKDDASTTIQTSSPLSSSSSVLPLGWEERQNSKQLEQIQNGAFSSSSRGYVATEINIQSMKLSNNNNSTTTTTKASTTTDVVMGASTTTSNSSTTTSSSTNRANSSAEIGLVKIATHTLETLAETLNSNPTSIPMKEREEFATAMRHAMEVMAKFR